MADSPTRQAGVTRILREIEEGHASAAERLLPLVYEEMRSLAEGFMRGERPGHTLQATALVHETYLRLVNQREVEWQGRAHFLAAAAQAMRRILIQHAERRRAAKRGGGWQRISLSDCEDSSGAAANDESGLGEVDLLALDEALARLEALDQRQCRVVELRFFAGLSVEETAQVLGFSPRLIKLDWQMARAWLHTQLVG